MLSSWPDVTLKVVMHCSMSRALILSARLAAEPILDIAAIGMNEGLTSSAVTIVTATANGKPFFAAALDQHLTLFVRNSAAMKTSVTCQMSITSSFLEQPPAMPQNGAPCRRSATGS